MSRALVAVSATAGALVLGLRGGPLLMRDAVSTPRSHLTDAALGLTETPARAVPQDGLLAMVSTVVPGTVAVIAITWLALALAGIGAGLLATRVVGGGWAPQCAAALVAVWNPFVAERLMQGQWSLLAGYAAVPWIVLAGDRIRRSERGGWPMLWAAVVGAGLTPTGSLLAAVAVMVAVVSVRDLRRSAAALAAVVVGALPWLVATALSPSSTPADPAAAGLFALRAEPGLGRVLTALGMGGIWNADAVPGSRTTWWAGVATVLLLAVVVAGWVFVVRDLETTTVASRAALLALGSASLVVLASTPPGLSVLEFLIEHVPGAGLLRDTQKFLALLLPAVAIGIAGATRALGRLLPAGFAFAAVALLVAAPLPDAALRLHPVDLPDDWQRVVAIIPADRGAVALWPTGMVRDYSFTTTPSLDPARRLLRAPVLETGQLDVDGKTVDAAPASRAARVEDLLTRGGGPQELARHGVGWVLVEEPERNRTPAGLTDPVFSGRYLTLYRVENPVIVPGASAAKRAVAVGAHLTWLAVLLVALACAVAALDHRKATEAKTRSKPSAVADQE
ncbi:MAG: hypothetical protein QM728_14055 [Gordonia sp. (in: high G+C Gram-positive bacteria)]|uniref:hypothetical protein n=1 Tax=Gordonia sp. (in: high G+C Gram-positive bacteria) TaxID=84139 RepID=UPI0039E28806